MSLPLQTRVEVTCTRNVRGQWVKSGSLGTLCQQQPETLANRAVYLIRLDADPSTLCPLYAEEFVVVPVFQNGTL